MMAALHCFNEQGVEATAMAAICQRAGASVGSIYHHFGSKEGIVQALLVEGLANHAERLKSEIGHCKGAQDGVNLIITTLLDWIADNPDWAQFIYSVSREGLKSMGGERLKTVTRDYLETLEEFFVRQEDGAILDNVPRECLVALLVGPVHHFAKRWLQGSREKSIREYKALFCRADWQSLNAQAKCPQ